MYICGGIVAERGFAVCGIIYQTDGIRQSKVVGCEKVVHKNRLSCVCVEVKSACAVNVRTFICIISFKSCGVSVCDDEARLVRCEDTVRGIAACKADIGI